MSIRIIDAMRKIEILRGLSDQDLLRVADVCRAIRVPAGKTIFKEGDEGSEMYLIHEGRVRVVINSSRSDGSVASSTINILHANQCFGELIILNSGLRAATVVSIEPTILIVLGAAQFRQLCKLHPQIGYCMIYNLAQDLTTNLRMATLLLHGNVRLEAARAVGGASVLEPSMSEYNHVLLARENEIKDLNEINQTLEQQNQQLEASLRQYQRSLASTEAELQQMQEILEALEADKQQLEAQLSQHVQAVAAIDAELRHVNEQKALYDQQRRELNQQLRQTQRELAVKETDIAQMQERVQVYEQQIDDVMEQLRQHQDDSDYLNAVIAGYRERERQRRRMPWT